MVHWTDKDQPARLGLIVSKKVAMKAVERNRLKRLIRESFRCQPNLKPADYVVMAKPSAKGVINKQVMSDLMNMWQQT